MKWEYYWETGDDQSVEELLETKGDEGWELVSVTSREVRLDKDEKELEFTIFFKRPKQ